MCVCASIVHACISLAATFPQLGMDRTVWNFQDFSVTQILREINIIGESKISKTTVRIFFHYWGCEF